MSSSSFEPVFLHHFQFDLADAKNFLNPSIYFVGATWDGGEVEKLPDFIDRGVWVNGYGEENTLFLQRVMDVKRGDILVIKRLLGVGQGRIKILAMGVVVGFSHRRESIYVAWTLPDLDFEVPFQGIDGVKTISASHTINDFRDDGHEPLRKAIINCRAKFLRMNLEVKPRSYVS